MIMNDNNTNTNPNANLDPQDSLRDMIQIQPEEIFGGWEGSWAGDGSGMDDLADFNANEGLDN
jgi:hypothetical protein